MDSSAYSNENITNGTTQPPTTLPSPNEVTNGGTTNQTPKPNINNESHDPAAPPVNESNHIAATTTKESNQQNEKNGIIAAHSPSTLPTTKIPFPTLTGKVALITGASRGIGAGIALELGSRGCSLAINYNTDAFSAQKVVAKLQSLSPPCNAIAIQADVSKVSEITRLFEKTVERFGKLDIVCSNSGMESFEHVSEITEERFDKVFNLNLKAQFFVGQAAYKYCQPGGRLILMSSIAAGLISVGHHALYSGSKSAINGITKSFAKDFGDKGITVNAIAPGGVKSDMFAQVAWRYIPGGTREWSAEEIEGKMAGACPLGRCAEPVDVARVVAFLMGEDGGWVNGESLLFFLLLSLLGWM